MSSILQVFKSILLCGLRDVCGCELNVVRHTFLYLAESNSLAAARANNLEQCQRLKVLEDYFIIQQCAPKNLTIGMKTTRCSHEPIYKTLRLEKTVFRYISSKVVFRKMIQSLSKKNILIDRRKMD